MSGDDPLDDLVERLLRLRDGFGDRPYRAAARAALGAVAAVVLDEAERRAGVRRAPTGTVVRFPLGRRRRRGGRHGS